MYGKDGQFFGTHGFGGEAYEPIKIAVLDSSIFRNCLRPYLRQIKFMEDFQERSRLMTKVELVLKVCPTAHLCIARVTKPNPFGEPTVDVEAAAKTIRYAADPRGWGVDIINMSFGGSYSDKLVNDALAFAKEKQVLMFASTTNHGFTEVNNILYPGRAPEVICVDAAEDTGKLAGFATEDIRQRGIERFSALGLGIVSPKSGKPMNGSSFVCLIAAGIAALILEFTRQVPLRT
jgi:hypothetical protein